MKKLNLIGNYKGLPKSIYFLSFASIVNSLGNFVMPFLTLFLTNKAGLNAPTVAVIVSINSAIGMVASLIGGKLIDNKGRKGIFVIFRSLYAITIMSCAFVRNPYVLTTLLMIAPMFSGITSPVYSTMITDLTDESERKVAFSLEYMAINIGCSVGPFLAGVLYRNYLKWLFIGDGITTLIAMIVVALFVPETSKIMKNKNMKDSNIEVDKKESLWSVYSKQKTLVIFSLILIIYFVVFSQFNFGLSLQIGQVFKEDMSWVYGTILAINSVMCAVFTPVLISLTKNKSCSLSIAIAGVFYCIGFGMMAFISSFFMFVISTILWTTGEILVANNTNVYIANHSPDTHRGRFNSVFPMIKRLGFILGPIVSGTIIKYSAIKNLWLFVGGISLIGAMMMYKLYMFDKNQVINKDSEVLEESV